MTSAATTLHIPVLLGESVDLLNAQPGGKYIDCTVGTGGHAMAVLEAISPGGQLLAIDADPGAIEVAKERLKIYGEAVTLVNDKFEHLDHIASEHSFCQVQGILFDLGLSSLQLEDASQGFSFQLDAPLDMRFSPRQQITAADIVNTFPEGEIASILKRYGEEPQSRHIARRIVANRPLESTGQLARIVEQTVGRKGASIHPATRTFQALRIAVNQELECLRDALKQAVNILATGGRLVVIGYHSLENRVVKEFVRQEARGCICAPSTPVCVCEHEPTMKLVTKRVVRPSLLEVEVNHRSRSAKLRAAERL